MSNSPIIKFPGARYHSDCLEGRIFYSEAEVPKGWTDNPNDFASDPLDHDKDGKKGGSPDPLATEKDALAELRAAYVEKFGKKPFMGWDAETLKEKMSSL